MAISAEEVKGLARQCGFELAGISLALPILDYERYQSWRAEGRAGEMTYLTDRRGDLRQDPRNLLADAKTIISVGKLYNTSEPFSAHEQNSALGWISRYAWGVDYHDVMRRSLEELVVQIAKTHGQVFSSKVCIDTAPLLERSYARAAGLGWIGKNTCLINQEMGSWFFLGEILSSLDLAPDSPPPNRCGTCTRCIDACPTSAIEWGETGWRVHSSHCISYLTIEKRGDVPEELQAGLGNHLFGCDICQDVCPWNRNAPQTDEPEFLRADFPQSLETLANYTEDDFRREFRQSPVWRAKYSGFLRNVAIAMGNSGNSEMHEPLKRLISHHDESVARAARQSLERLLESIAIRADS